MAPIALPVDQEEQHPAMSPSAQQDRRSSIAFWTSHFTSLKTTQFPELPSFAYVPRPTTSFSHEMHGLGWESSHTKPSVFIRLAWAILQSRWTKNPDVVFGAASGFNGMPFPVRITLDPGATVVDAMTNIQRVAGQMAIHADIGADAIGGVSDEAEQACDFQTLLLLLSQDNAASQQLEMHGRRRTSIGDCYALTLECKVLLDSLKLRIISDPNIVSTDDIEKMASQLGHILRQILMHPQANISDITSNAYDDYDSRGPLDECLPMSPKGSIAIAQNCAAPVMLPGPRRTSDFGLPPRKGSSAGVGHASRGHMTVLQLQLQQLWAEVLGIKNRSTIDANSDWYQLGGDEASALRLVVAARDWMLSLTVADVLSRSKLADMAESVKHAHRPSADLAVKPVETTPRHELPLLPLTPSQKAAIEHGIPTQADFYAFDLPSGMSTSAAAHVCGKLVQHFEALRLVFIDVQGTTYQTVLPTLDIPIEVQDVGGSVQSASDYIKTTSANTAANRGHSFLQIHLLRKEPSQHRLILRTTPAQLDAFSTTLIASALDDLCAGKPLPKPASLTDRLRLHEGENESKQFWQQHTPSHATTIIPPQQPSEPPTLTTTIFRKSITLPHKPGTPASTVFTAVVALALSRYLPTANPHITLGRRVPGRAALPPALQPLVGPCSTIIPAHFHTSDPDSSLLQQAMSQHLASLPHEHTFDPTPTTSSHPPSEAPHNDDDNIAPDHPAPPPASDRNYDRAFPPVFRTSFAFHDGPWQLPGSGFGGGFGGASAAGAGNFGYNPVSASTPPRDLDTIAEQNSCRSGSGTSSEGGFSTAPPGWRGGDDYGDGVVGEVRGGPGGGGVVRKNSGGFGVVVSFVDDDDSDASRPLRGVLRTFLGSSPELPGGSDAVWVEGKKEGEGEGVVVEVRAKGMVMGREEAQRLVGEIERAAGEV